MIRTDDRDKNWKILIKKSEDILFMVEFDDVPFSLTYTHYYNLLT